MRKRLLILLGLLLIGVNVFAAGDLQVNGGLGLGTAPNSNFKADVSSANLRGVKVTSVMDQDGIVSANILKGIQLQAEIAGSATGAANGIALISLISSTAAAVDNMTGGSFINSFSGASAGLPTYVNYSAAGKFDTLLNPGSHAYNVTAGYGFDLYLRDFSQGSTGTLHFDDFVNININSAANDFGKLSIDNLSGIWINKQTLGGTSNRGIVLDGDGAGADIVLGASQETSIYASGGEIFVKDGASNVTQISPHDPETGEWRFYSKNMKTGRVIQINMEKLVKAVEKLTGETFMVETLIQE